VSPAPSRGSSAAILRGPSPLGNGQAQMSPVTGAWALVAVLILLPSIAFATVLDPMWVPGIYDELDGDDVVTVITETAASQVEISYLMRAVVLSEEVLIREARRCGSSPLHLASRGPPQPQPRTCHVLSSSPGELSAIHLIHFECPSPRMFHSRLPSPRMEPARAHHDLRRYASAIRSHGRTCAIPGDAFRNRIGLGS
jgi:hypothetical protein